MKSFKSVPNIMYSQYNTNFSPDTLLGRLLDDTFTAASFFAHLTSVRGSISVPSLYTLRSNSKVTILTGCVISLSQLPSILIFRHDEEKHVTSIHSQFSLWSDFVRHHQCTDKLDIIQIFKLNKFLVKDDEAKEVLDPTSLILNQFKVSIGQQYWPYFYDKLTTDDTSVYFEELNTVYEKINDMFYINLKEITELRSLHDPLITVAPKYFRPYGVVENEFGNVFFTDEVFQKDKYGDVSRHMEECLLPLYNPIHLMIISGLYHYVVQAVYNESRMLINNSGISSSDINTILSKDSDIFDDR